MFSLCCDDAVVRGQTFKSVSTAISVGLFQFFSGSAPAAAVAALRGGVAGAGEEVGLGWYVWAQGRGGCKGEGKLFCSPEEGRIAFD